MDRNNFFDIGKRNYLALRKILWKSGILLSSEAVGGGNSRTVRLEIESGRLWLQEGCGKREMVRGFPRPTPLDKTEPPSARGGSLPRSTKTGEGHGLPSVDRR